MRKVFCLLTVYFLILTSVHAQSKPVQTTAKKPTPKTKAKTIAPAIDSAVVAPGATKDARVAFFKKVQNEYVNVYLSSPLHKDTEKDWMIAFDGMLKVGFKSPLASSRLHYAFADISGRSIPFQEALLELLYTNYPIDFQEEVIRLLDETPSPKIFALCVEYLIQGSRNNEYKSYFKKLLDQKMLSDPNNPFYLMLDQRLQNKKYTYPPIVDLLKFDFIKGNMVLFSIQRTDRDYPGILLIRKADGKFLRNADNSIFYLPQVARSITDLPGYFNAGNTPQGVYRMNGIETTKDEFIGPTPAIRLWMPYEAKVFRFNPRIKDTLMYWNQLFYKNLIPASWRSHEPFYEAYYAGMAGRKGIIAHGTTVNPEYYAGKPWYPLTLFTGALSSKELWDDKTGKRLESDQEKLINSLKKAGSNEGYFIVVEMDDQEKAVNISELENIILSIEGGG